MSLRRLSFKLLTLVVGVAVPLVLARAAASNLSLQGFSNRAVGPDRLFYVKIANNGDQGIYLRGRLVAISVYDTSQPTVMPLEQDYIPAHSTGSFEARWVGAPMIGRIRALLVISDGNGDSEVESFDFWLLPLDTVAWAFGIAAVAALAVVLMRRFRHRRRFESVPANMVAHRVEYDDTVMAIANRYQISWQDLVHANRLKPPYDLRIGQRLLIPRHPLSRPPESETNPKP